MRILVPLSSVAQPPAAFRRAEGNDDILDLEDSDDNQNNAPALGRTYRQFANRRNALNRPFIPRPSALLSDHIEESESIKSSDDEDSILDSNSDSSSKMSSGVDDSDWSEADEILDKSD